MFLPDSFLIQKIKIQHAYCDRASKENSTGVVKTKYKLAGNLVPLQIYTFFVATKNRFACKPGSFIEVKKQDWDQLSAGHLREPIGYLDINKIEPLTEQELLAKIKDKNNGFNCVAKLSDAKFQELKALRSRAHMNQQPIEKTALINIALADVVDLNLYSQDVIDKLGLN
jgi:hypothetical protein